MKPKICSRCKKEHQNYINYCKECNTEIQRVYAEKNKEKIRVRKQKWYQDNKEKINAKHAEYQKKNKEKINTYQRKRYHAKAVVS